ncbi:hypothetical protein [Bradyrhizobium sp. CCGUVB23]|uniref:hypothetical protein n=1 Tax=Bradyrhizobium sp. CCGUVB23 TaxID=2949630 RepID=UPI0020B45BC8|nr:hypothetical protein [Bradyrhizobium sp. CCGUVB23]MCP3468640.1 hypothetical protein [Bradyrhizobium sp. CCGUVB23]
MDRDSGGVRRVADLPNEVFGEVAKRLPTDDPLETVKNLTNLRLVSRSVQKEVEGASIKTFRRRLKQLVKCARVLHRIAIPSEGLPENAQLPQQHEDEFSAPSHRAQSVGAILKFQSVESKSAFVNHILILSRAVDQAQTIASIATRLGDLDDGNKDRLVNRAIELFGQEGQDWVDQQSRHCAAQALLTGYDHLNADQKVKTLDAMRTNPDLFSVCAAQSHHLDASLTSTSRSASGHAAEPQNADLGQRLQEIWESIVDVGVAPWEGSAREQVDAIRPIGESISEAYNSARADLMASDRSREHSNLAG